MVGEWKNLPEEIKLDCGEVCKSCYLMLYTSKAANTGPFLLDDDGVDVEVSKKPGKWRHAWDDAWWTCDAAGIVEKAGEATGFHRSTERI